MFIRPIEKLNIANESKVSFDTTELNELNDAHPK
jgi:hypothetical protein